MNSINRPSRYFQFHVCEKFNWYCGSLGQQKHRFRLCHFLLLEFTSALVFTRVFSAFVSCSISYCTFERVQRQARTLRKRSDEVTSISIHVDCSRTYVPNRRGDILSMGISIGWCIDFKVLVRECRVKDFLSSVSSERFSSSSLFAIFRFSTFQSSTRCGEATICTSVRWTNVSLIEVLLKFLRSVWFEGSSWITKFHRNAIYNEEHNHKTLSIL